MLGNAANPEETTRSSRQVARMLNSLGINFNLAPVVDLNIYKENPIIGAYGRSFSEHADIVFENTANWVAAHRQSNTRLPPVNAAATLSCLRARTRLAKRS